MPQEEAERRAAICAGCPLNKAETWCAGCFMKALMGRVASMLGGWATSSDAKLKSCGVCGCKLSLKVWVPKGVMKYPDLKDRWPEWCWARD